MDFLHGQLANVQKQLSFVQTDSIDWKLYVQVFSWSVTLFESYLLLVHSGIIFCRMSAYLRVQTEAVSSLLQDGTTSSSGEGL